MAPNIRPIPQNGSFMLQGAGLAIKSVYIYLYMFIDLFLLLYVGWLP